MSSRAQEMGIIIKFQIGQRHSDYILNKDAYENILKVSLHDKHVRSNEDLLLYNYNHHCMDTSHKPTLLSHVTTSYFSVISIFINHLLSILYTTQLLAYNSDHLSTKPECINPANSKMKYNNRDHFVSSR